MNRRDSLSRESRVVQAILANQVRVAPLFFWLLVVQSALSIALALWLSPRAWEGTQSTLHLHVKLALGFSLLNGLPLYLLRCHADWWGTRQLVAVVQMLWSAVFIHITGGRIETHFHVFVSLAFLSAYADWKLYPTATIVVAADHLTRGMLWPESVYGIANPEWWRFLEHAAWVAFEDVVLVIGCFRAARGIRDVTEREMALEELNANVESMVATRTEELQTANTFLADEMKARSNVEAELRQAQKLEAVGRLASGVAHEINTPIQFVSDSVSFVRDAMGDLFHAVSQLQKVQAAARTGEPVPETVLDEADSCVETADLVFVEENVPKALERSLEGLERVATIVRSMKDFAHPDAREKTSVDLNRAIQSTLTIARHEYKLVADIDTDFGELPLVSCHAGELNQAVLNIVVNAAHAIGDVVAGTESRGRISIRTRVDEGDAIISITDTGGGIPEHVRSRIFDPFFTTKAVGKGTGQGLAIARQVLVEKHGGDLTFETALGKGTTFHLRIPLHNASSSVEAAA